MTEEEEERFIMDQLNSRVPMNVIATKRRCSINRINKIKQKRGNLADQVRETLPLRPIAYLRMGKVH
jgi:hypothetical protein